jgi:serine/threonine-protein kinase
MVTGRVPFDHPTGVKTLMAHVNDPPPPLRQVNPIINPSPLLEQAIMRCLAKDPADRFRSMDEVLVSLRRAGGATASSAGLTGTGEQAALAGSGVYGAAALSGEHSIPAPLGAFSALARSSAWAAVPARKKMWIGGLAGALVLAGIAGAVVVKSRHARAVASSSPPSAASASSRAAEGVAGMAAPPPAALRGDSESFHLVLSSDPPEALVEWGGKPVGQTPMMVDLLPGPQSFVISRDGYFSATFITTVTDAMTGQNQSRTVVLVPRKGNMAANVSPRAAAPAEARVIGAARAPTAQPAPEHTAAAAMLAAPGRASSAPPEPDTASSPASPPAAIAAAAAAPAPPVNTPAAPTAPAVLPFGPDMSTPVLQSGTDPVWTREALLAHVEGVMIAKCTITTGGTLQNCRVIKGLPFMDKSLLDALASRHYSPVMYQGHAVAVEYVFSVRLKQR